MYVVYNDWCLIWVTNCVARSIVSLNLLLFFFFLLFWHWLVSDVGFRVLLNSIVLKGSLIWLITFMANHVVSVRWFFV